MEDRGFLNDAGKVIDVIQELIFKIDTLMKKLEEAIALMKSE